MNFFGNRIRAILLPLLVALLCIAGLGWYQLVRTPARQTYLNERNLRALRTRSAQIKKQRSSNFDQPSITRSTPIRSRRGGWSTCASSPVVRA